MTFAKHASNHRTQAQNRPRRRTEPHPIHDLRRGRTGAPILPPPRKGARAARCAWSSLTVEAATTLSYCAGHALPALLFGIFSWAVSEILASFAAYAEAMHPPPAPGGLPPAETDVIDSLRAASPSLSRMPMQVIDGSAGYSNQTSPGIGPAVPTTGYPAMRNDGRVSLECTAAAWWSSLYRARDRRRAIEELQGLDDRSLHDIGVSRCDIAYIVRYGARRE